MSSSRYDGKPLLRLLECYVLNALGLLSESQNCALKAIEPKLGQTYNRRGTWDEIIAATMEFPETMPALIREKWRRNQEIAKANGVELTGQQFAEMFVDANFEHFPP